MPDNLPNSDASAVVTPSTGPSTPQTQSPDMGGQQIAQTPQPTQQMPLPVQSLPAQQTPPPQSGWHKALQSLMGYSTQYTQDPNGGPPVASEVPNKPGQLFRSILAGAIMGGAAGQEAHNQNPYSGFAGGLAPGAKAGMQNQQAGQQKSQQQAQQQWQNQLTANKEKRDQTVEDREAQMFPARKALLNQTVLTNELALQNSSLDLHQKESKADQNRYDAMFISGVSPVTRAVDGKPRLLSQIPSAEVVTMKHSPGFSTDLIWIRDPEPKETDVTNPDGTVSKTWDNTLSAYDPKDNITLTKTTVDQLKKDGLFNYYPQAENMLKEGKQLTPFQFADWMARAQTTHVEKLKEDVQNETILKLQADVETDKKRVAAELRSAATGERNATNEARRLVLEENNQFATTIDKENENLRKQVDETLDQGTKNILLQRIANNDAEVHRRFGYGGNEASSGADPAVAAAVSRLKGLPQTQIDQALANPAITPAQKTAIRQGLGLSSGTSGVNADSFRDLSPHAREMALAASHIPLTDEDHIRRSLGIDTPDDSKYANDITVQRQIKKMKGQSPEQIADKLSDFDLTPGQLEAIARGVKRAH